MKRTISILLMVVMVACCTNAIAASKTDEGYDIAFVLVSEQLGTPIESMDDTAIFESLETSTFRTKRSSNLIIIDIEKRLVSLFGKLNGNNSKKSTWENMTYEAVFEVGYLILENYKSINSKSTGSFSYVIYDSAKSLYVDTVAEANAGLKKYKSLFVQHDFNSDRTDTVVLPNPTVQPEKDNQTTRFTEENSAEEWTCVSCGKTASGNFCNYCGTPKPSESWICPNCKNIATGNFCNHCGEANPENKNNPTEPADDNSEEVKVYPLSFTSSLKQYTIPLPEICYTTPASENGYSGLPCYVSGKVTKIYKENETAANTPISVVLSTAYGPVFFYVLSPDYILQSNTDAIFNTESGRAYFYSLFDTTMDYTLPEIGEYVTIYGVYSGYSSLLNMAALYFGLDEFVYSFSFGGEYTPSNFQTEEKTSKDEKSDSGQIVTVKEYGFDSKVNGYYYYSVILHNNMTDKAIRYPEIRITARDANGDLLSVDSQTLNVIYPGQDAVWAGLGGSVEIAPSSIHVEYVEPTDNWHIVSTTQLEHPNYMPLEVKSARIKQARWTSSIIGEIYNPNSYDFSMVAITVIFRDKNGHLLAGNTGYIYSLKGNSTSAFEINVSEKLLTESFEVFGQPW